MQTLHSSLSCMDLPEESGPVTDADSMFEALLAGCDGKGRYFADPRLVRVLFWWQPTWPTPTLIASWLDELIVRELIEVRPDGICTYSGEPFWVLYVRNRQRYTRFKRRAPIPAALRAAVYERDGHKCVRCGATEDLALDHVYPWSKGGEDTFDNLQTMCRPCNTRKGAKVE